MVRRVQSLTSHTSLRTSSSVLSSFFLSVSCSLLHTFSLTDSLCLLCFPLAISSRKKPDDLRLPSFSLSRLSPLNMSCVCEVCELGETSQDDGWQASFIHTNSSKGSWRGTHIVQPSESCLLGCMGFHLCLWEPYVGHKRMNKQARAQNYAFQGSVQALFVMVI